MNTKQIVSLLITIIFLGNVKASTEQVTPEILIENQAKEVLSDDRFHSLSIGVVHGKNSHVGHFGELTIGKGNTPTNDTLYEIGSVTKTMTGLLVADAIASGKLSLDADINNYLRKELAFVGDKNNPLTIKQLVTHISGLPRTDSELKSKEAITSQVALLRAVANFDRSAKQGKYSYSNVGYEVLGAVLSSVYNQSFDALLQDKMSRLAKMSNTQVNLKPTQMTKFAYGYDEQGEPAKAFTEPTKFWGSSGFIKSNMTDLVNYMKLQLNSENKVIQRTHQTMFEVTKQDAIAYTWIKATDKTLGQYFIHHGGMYGTQNWMIVFPEKQMAISIITNTSFPEVGGILRDAAFTIVRGLDKAS